MYIEEIVNIVINTRQISVVCNRKQKKNPVVARGVLSVIVERPVKSGSTTNK